MIRSRGRRAQARNDPPGDQASPADVPDPLQLRRIHGDLEWITDSERRPLRPIGTTAMDVALRTGVLLADLIALPRVRIFCGVWSACARMPLITHAIAAGRSLVLVESVAWPPGRYSAETDGRVFCGDQYIGQSVGSLAAAVRHWRGVLPRDHRVAAMVVVHHTVDGEISLTATASEDLSWTLARDAVRAIQRHLPRRQALSDTAVGALIAATAGQE